MWVTQSYLHPAEPNAGVFVYYMFENYRSEHVQLTQRVQAALEKLGDVYGTEVSLHMPNPRYADGIEGQVREIRPLWEAVRSGLPGLLVATRPMADLSGLDDAAFFIPFAGQQPEAVAEAIHHVRGLTDTLLREAELVPVEPPWGGRLFARLNGAIELRPGIWGFAIDLRRLFR